MNRVDLGRLLLSAVRSLGMFVFLAIAAAVVLRPALFTESAGPATAARRADDDAKIVEAEITDFWASEGFMGVAQAVGAEPDAPSWQSVRTLMESRGCTDLRYVVRLRWRRVDGMVDYITYIRHPYHEPWNIPEFIDILRGDFDSTGFPIQFRDRTVDIGPDDTSTPGDVLHRLLRPDGLPR